MTTKYNESRASVIMNETGAYHFTRCFLSLVNNKSKGIVAFPMDFFYPLPNNKRDTLVPYLYTKPFSYAIHHWAVSWVKNKRHV
jgi:hypothetical protein